MATESILIVDNEPKISGLVRQLLTDEGFAVLITTKGERAIQLTALEQPHLILLDINLSGEMDGFEVVRRIREFSAIPVIMLSSRDSSNDILHGFDLGIDDYVTKPFESKILLARIRAVLKRSSEISSQPTINEFKIGNLIIDLARRQVTRDGIEIHLTQTEFNLLSEFVKHSNQVLIHEYLLSAVWGDQFHNEIDYLRSYVHVLRRKLEYSPADPKFIISKPGVGYMFVSDLN
jgi:two-component system KDP operon response regulator KdpE